MKKWTQMGLFVGGSVALMTTEALAATGLTIDGAVTAFQSLFMLGVFLLGTAGLTTIVYSVARSRYGVVWDEALSVMKAAAIGGSSLTILGLVGVTPAATVDQRDIAARLTPPAIAEVFVAPEAPTGLSVYWDK